MKFGYSCKCGNFTLKRGKLTRKEYASTKRKHAAPKGKGGDGCTFLARELARTGEEPFNPALYD